MDAPVVVHLVDGTYELFRCHYGQPEEVRSRPGTRGAVRGVLHAVLQLVEDGATHVGVATDQVIESFRNELWPGYKTSAGMDPLLLEQFPVLEAALESMGVPVWGMVELEADDALAAAAAALRDDPSVRQVVIHTPDKDLGQCVVGTRVVQFDRRNQRLLDEAAIVARFGVRPASIPDYLALVGDSSDGYPGLPGWGPKSAAAVLARYGHLEHVPADASAWNVPVRGAAKLAATLVAGADLARLFRDLATLRTEPPVVTSPDQLRWQGPTEGFAAVAAALDGSSVAQRAAALGARLR